MGMLTLEERARVHGALAEPHRLAIVDELATSDRTPRQLGDQLGVTSNLLAHHLDVLEAAGLIHRFPSTSDRRRRYIRLVRAPLADLVVATAAPAGTVLFVCTQNAARSQLAAALWTDRTGRPAGSAGTRPAPEVHPRAVEAAARVGLDLGHATPSLLEDQAAEADLVVTVCDRANEELAGPTDWWHWSTPDPVATGTDAAFDAVVTALDARIQALTSPR